MPKYNGHKNYNHWNVALWIFNHEPNYNLMRTCIKGSDTLDEAAKMFAYKVKGNRSHFDGGRFIPAETITPNPRPNTPDGAPWSVTAIRAAIKGWDE